jgi:hypothetical protein
MGDRWILDTSKHIPAHYKGEFAATLLPHTPGKHFSQRSRYSPGKAMLRVTLILLAEQESAVGAFKKLRPQFSE